MATLDPNQKSIIGFENPAGGNAWHVQVNLINAEVQGDYTVLILQKEQTCLFLSFWLGISS